MGLTTHRGGLIVSVLGYALLLHYFYDVHIHVRWHYMGFASHDVSPWVSVSTLAVALAPSVWMPIALARPSQVGYWLLYVLVYIPSVLVPPRALGGGSTWLELDVTLLACMGLLALVYRQPTFGLRRPRTPRERLQFWVGFGLVAGALYAGLLFAFGLKLEVPRLAEIYNVRADYKLTIKSVGSWASYALGFAGNVINPFLMVAGFSSRRPWLMVLGAAGQLFLFTITALKSILLSTLLIAALFAALRRRGNNFGFYITGGVTGMLVLGLTEVFAAGSSYIGDVLVRRMIYIPGLLTGMYVDFFSSHPKAMLGHSVLRGVVRYPYDVAPAKLVGGAYFEAANSNASVWADGFANFGLAGIVGATVILGAVFWLFDCASKGLDRASSAAMFGLPGLSIANSGVLTALLTHGIGLVTLLAAAAPILVRPEIPTSRGDPPRKRRSPPPDR